MLNEFHFSPLQMYEAERLNNRYINVLYDRRFKTADYWTGKWIPIFALRVESRMNINRRKTLFESRLYINTTTTYNGYSFILHPRYFLALVREHRRPFESLNALPTSTKSPLNGKLIFSLANSIPSFVSFGQMCVNDRIFAT